MMPWVPSPPLLRRRSRYLPVVRLSAVAHAARCNCESLDSSPLGCLWLSCVGMQFLVSPSMPRHRDARGMPSSFSSPIGWRHPDLAQPQLSRSCPTSALAVTRPDHALHPFRLCGDGGNYQCSFFFARTSGFDADPARDRLSAPVTGAGFCTYFQVDAVAAHPDSILSQTDKTLGAGDRLARRRHTPLDRAARPDGVMGKCKPLAKSNNVN